MVEFGRDRSDRPIYAGPARLLQGSILFSIKLKRPSLAILAISSGRNLCALLCLQTTSYTWYA